MPKPIVDPHDKIFKVAMANELVARDFFQHHLPAKISQHIDFSSLRLLQQSYLNAELQASFSDLVFQCDIQGTADHQDGQVGELTLLVEHQSSPDRWLPLRVHEYLFGILNRKRKAHPKRKLSPVYVMVFYHGETSPYPYNLNLLDCFADPLNIMESLLFQPIPLIDVNSLPDEQLKKQRWIGPLALGMKHIRDKNFGPALETVLTSLDWPLEEPIWVELLQQFLLYLYSSGNTENVNQYLQNCYEKVSAPVRRTLMTIAEQLESAGFERGIEQGIEQGIEKGEAALLIKLLNKRFGPLSDDITKRINAARSEELEAWGEKIFDIRNPQELF